jgi:type IV secretory pathway VirB2 component (pilin)
MKWWGWVVVTVIIVIDIIIYGLSWIAGDADEKAGLK